MFIPPGDDMRAFAVFMPRAFFEATKNRQTRLGFGGFWV